MSVVKIKSSSQHVFYIIMEEYYRQEMWRWNFQIMSPYKLINNTHTSHYLVYDCKYL